MWTTDDLCPNIIQKLRKRARPFVSIVDPDGGLEYLSVEALHNASNRAAWFLTHHLAKNEQRFLYMGPSDIRYLIWVVGAMKAGKCAIYPSPSNTVSSNERFFSTVGATTLLYAPESSASLHELLQLTAKTVTPIPTPSYSEMLDPKAVDEFPFPHTFDEIKDVPFMGLHTSGTSGHPKPIFWTHAAFASLAIPFDCSALPNPPKAPNVGIDMLQGNNVFVGFYLYHFGGLVLLFLSLATDSTIVYPAPGVRLSPENFAKMLEVSSSTSMLVPPSLLESVSNRPRELQIISKMTHVTYGGGPLNPILGHELAKVVPRLIPLYGSTEGGVIYQECASDSTCWNRIKFIDLGQRMEEVIPGLYELVIPRTDLINRTCAYFHTFPQLEVYRTSDLFAPVEGSDGWWVFHGRTNNWVTMSSGHKVDPTEMENAVSAHPDVMGVLAAGSHRFRLCLLVELRPGKAPKNEEQRQNILDELWLTVQEANKSAPKFGRVPKELIILTSPDKPLERASKGTIQRRPNIAAYEEEIENVYAKLGEGLLTDGVPPLGSTGIDDLLLFLKDVYTGILDTNDIAVGDDLFAKGLDSLSIFILAARIKAGLRKFNIQEETLKRVDNSLLFSSSTILTLAQRLSLILSERNGVDQIKEDRSTDDVRDLLTRYEARIPTILREGRQESKNVILTGSRGTLGSHILAALLAREDVKKVYCLNRSLDAQSRKQSSSFGAKGLSESQLQRVILLQASLAEPKLGLSEGEYADLKADATVIIHNAYPVNFLMPVRSFEAQIQSLLNLLKLAQESVRDPAVLFVSSIAAALPVSGSRDTVSETVLDVEEVGSISPHGYSQSKFICEKLMEKYLSSSGSKGAILRVGQITGPLQGDGVWNVREWVPSMIISSKYLGAVPESIGTATMEWLPVDALGRIVSELIDDIAQREDDGAIVYNVLNPEPASWSELLQAIKEVIPVTVPAAEWVAKLERSQGEGSRVLDKNPGLKLIDFYKEAFLDDSRAKAPVFEKENLLRGSKTARELSRVKAEHMAKWMKGWGL